MKHCPNFKEIKISAKMEEENDWKYLSTFLSRNARWKLQSIGINYYERSLFKENFKSYYYQCLYTSRDTLRKMTLIKT